MSFPSDRIKADAERSRTHAAAATPLTPSVAAAPTEPVAIGRTRSPQTLRTVDLSPVPPRALPLPRAGGGRRGSVLAAWACPPKPSDWPGSVRRYRNSHNTFHVDQQRRIEAARVPTLRRRTRHASCSSLCQLTRCLLAGRGQQIGHRGEI